MTQTEPPKVDITAKRGNGAGTDVGFRALAFVSGGLVLAILGLIAVTTVTEALPAFREAGASFVTSSRWAPNNPDNPVFGTFSFVYGTLVTSFIALLVAVPVSIGIALFLTELAPRRIRTAAITVIDLLAAIPSVVFGLVGALVVAPFLVPMYAWLHETFGSWPVLGSVFGPPSATGYAFLTAGMILAFMVIPIITSISREVFDTVPLADKQAAYALGATRWEMIKGAVFPHSFGGLVGATMLGLGRAMGETIAVALVIGSATQVGANMLAPGNTMAAVIVQQWGEAGTLTKSALIGIGVVLFVMTIVVNYTARTIVRRAEVRMRGAHA
ncbi:MAG: phosphate ABC transporter permease subunit PstC [Stackebrandtia sp.]